MGGPPPLLLIGGDVGMPLVVGGECIMGTAINALHLFAWPLPAMADNIGSGHGIVVLVDICFGGIGIVELGGGGVGIISSK